MKFSTFNLLVALALAAMTSAAPVPTPSRSNTVGSNASNSGTPFGQPSRSNTGISDSTTLVGEPSRQNSASDSAILPARSRSNSVSSTTRTITAEQPGHAREVRPYEPPAGLMIHEPVGGPSPRGRTTTRTNPRASNNPSGVPAPNQLAPPGGKTVRSRSKGSSNLRSQFNSEGAGPSGGGS